MVDPAFASRDYPPFHDGVEMDAFMKEANGSLYTGVVWPGPTNFPDWFAPKSQAFWDQQFHKFFNPKTGVDVDGIWIDMNEPSNFCDYPCPDPEQTSIQNRNPPRPPPARMYSPYDIPGFPKNFQPHCMATVTFNVAAEIQDGEDLLLLGDTLSMGNSTPYYAPRMKGSNGAFNLVVQLPANTNVTYNYPRYTHDGEYIYEDKNHTLSTGDCGSYTSVTDSWITHSTSKRNSKKQLSSRSADLLIEKRQTISSKGPGSKMGLPGRELIDPPYDIKAYFGQLSGQTMPTNLRHANGLYEYDVHNFYGSVMGKRTHNSLQMRRPGQRPFM
jgi:alpha-glucosidase